jgi:sensor histidine kinase YesM
MKINAKVIAVHIIGWVVFLSLPHFIFELIGPHHMPPHDHQGMHPPPPHPYSIFGVDPTIVVFNILLIAFYYINSLVLIPQLLGRRMRLWYSASIILFMIVVVSSPGIVSMMFPNHHHSPDNENHREMIAVRVLVTTLVFASIFIVSTGIRIIKEWYGAEQENKQIQLEKTTAELSFLKAQINPHFLFNTLNNIYSLSIKKSEATPEAILLLADMMRYVLSDAQNDHVPLQDETAYLSKYIDLQKLRLTNKVSIIYDVKGDTDSNVIAPLILVPFIENAFKFGISTHEASTIQISIDVEHDTLKMKVANKLFPQTNLIAKSSGIGLVNVKRRLSLLYPDKYRLNIDPDQKGNYIVELEINLSV